MGRPFALDFGAIMAVGVARGVDIALLAELLPTAERIVLGALCDDLVTGED